MLEEITNRLYEASQQRQMCRIQMKGEPLSRVVHPYGICRTSGDKIILVCWQSLGFTHANGQPGYRNLSLLDCESVETMDQVFLVDPGFNPADKQYVEWVYHI